MRSNNTFNVYCDESCHLENDRQPVMLFGAVWCKTEQAKILSKELLDIMNKHTATGELKWNKVSKSRVTFYLEVVDWFIANSELNFRALIVNDKNSLDHKIYNQGSHDNFYYKCYFSLLNKIISPEKSYNIYLDIKDTRSRNKIHKLREILCNNVYDFTGNMIKHIQNIHSHESLLMQLSDFLLGAVSYAARHLSTNSTKLQIIGALEKHLGYRLARSTSLQQGKVNIFVFSPRKK